MQMQSAKWLTVAFALMISSFVIAQNPVKWAFEAKDAGGGQADLVFTATIDDGWYTYSQFLEISDGPLPTTFTYKEGSNYQLVGKAVESGDKTTAYDKVFEAKLSKFKHKAIFTQRVKVIDSSKPVTGYLEFMVCNDEMCMPPKTQDFSFKLPATAANNGGNTPIPVPDPKIIDPKKIDPSQIKSPNPGGEIATNPGQNVPPIQPAVDTPLVNTPSGPMPPAPDDANFKGWFDAKRPAINAQSFSSQCSGVIEEQKSYWLIFFLGFLGGLAALLTPCVFPMIPMTVTFFLKGSKNNRAKAIKNATIYGLSIIAIYTVLGVAITMLLGPTALNDMSTNVWFNLLFFAVFVLFALSFFGLFEITLPSWLTNSSDRMADKGGMIGIFFMAFTLALVSFSCTGAIVGSLLVETARATTASDMLFGSIPAKPAVGLFGFGVALGLPFALFAAFPSWLQSLPKSGGWLDNVKITLGFLELALAFKFLSTADLVEHWGALKIELFLAIWIIIALLIAAYQFGLTKWKGVTGKPGLGRLIVGGLSLILAGYMSYGLFTYQSLSLLSGIAPPVGYSFFRPNPCPHSLECYHDFDEALKVAQAKNKPLFVDFTGYGCVNCRKMEEQVWNKSNILTSLRDEYVVVSLYVDDKERLFPNDKFDYLLDPHTGDKMRTVGDKWGAFQVSNFNVSSQPYYVLLSNDGTTLLNKPVGYTPEVEEYRKFLDCGVSTFKTLKSAATPVKEVIQKLDTIQRDLNQKIEEIKHK
jgi:thiol:disulfide interchange protein